MAIPKLELGNEKFFCTPAVLCDKLLLTVFSNVEPRT